MKIANKANKELTANISLEDDIPKVELTHDPFTTNV